MSILIYLAYILHFAQNYTVLKLFQFIYGIVVNEALLLLIGRQRNAVIT